MVLQKSFTTFIQRIDKKMYYEVIQISGQIPLGRHQCKEPEIGKELNILGKKYRIGGLGRLHGEVIKLWVNPK